MGTTKKNIKAIVDSAIDMANLHLTEEESKVIKEAAMRRLEEYVAFVKMRGTTQGKLDYEKYSEAQLIADLIGLYERRNKLTPNLKAEDKVREHIKKILSKADLDLTANQESRLEDQMIGVFRDYIQTPESKRDEMYKLAEERVMRIIDPPGESHTMGSHY